jgi:hypothetical protein
VLIKSAPAWEMSEQLPVVKFWSSGRPFGDVGAAAVG